MPRGGNNQQRVPVDRAAAHVDALLAEFPLLTRSDIAHAAGVSRQITTVGMRPGQKILARTEEHLLAVQPRHLRLLPPPYVPVRLAQAHLRRLLALPGVTPLSLSRLSTFSHQAFYNVRDYAPEQTIYYRLHVGVMALTEDAVRAGVAFTDRAPAVEQVRRLQANGWPIATLSTMSGLSIGHVVNGKRDRMLVTTAAPVTALFERLRDTPGPSDRARQVARALGYYPDICYDSQGKPHPNWLRSDDAAA